MLSTCANTRKSNSKSLCGDASQQGSKSVNFPNIGFVKVALPDPYFFERIPTKRDSTGATLPFGRFGLSLHVILYGPNSKAALCGRLLAFSKQNVKCTVPTWQQKFPKALKCFAPLHSQLSSLDHQDGWRHGCSPSGGPDLRHAFTYLRKASVWHPGLLPLHP